MLKNTKLLTIGLMLFSLFFGAGNLIFPPLLGQGAGDQFFTAMLGFAVTGIGLPLLAVIAVGLSDGGLQKTIGSRVHPVFGLILSLVVYLSIGPYYLEFPGPERFLLKWACLSCRMPSGKRYGLCLFLQLFIF